MVVHLPVFQAYHDGPNDADTAFVSTRQLLLIIIIIIINDNVHGAVLMTMVTARVHPVHLMNAD